MMNRFKSNQAGRTMIEAMGYISVLIMLTVSVAAAVNSGYYKYRKGRVDQQLTDLKKVIGQRWVASESYGGDKGVKFETLVQEKIVPWSLREGRHAFSGEVEVGSPENTPSIYFITFSGLPKDVCVELGTRIWVVHDGSDLDMMKINKEKTWCWPFSVSSECDDSTSKLPAVLADVADACNDKNWKNEITWYFN